MGGGRKGRKQLEKKVLEHVQQRWTKPKKKGVLIGLFVRAGFKVHIPALFLGCESK